MLVTAHLPPHLFCQGYKTVTWDSEWYVFKVEIGNVMKLLLIQSIFSQFNDIGITSNLALSATKCRII